MSPGFQKWSTPLKALFSYAKLLLPVRRTVVALSGDSERGIHFATINALLQTHFFLPSWDTSKAKTEETGSKDGNNFVERKRLSALITKLASWKHQPQKGKWFESTQMCLRATPYSVAACIRDPFDQQSLGCSCCFIKQAERFSVDFKQLDKPALNPMG